MASIIDTARKAVQNLNLKLEANMLEMDKKIIELKAEAAYYSSQEYADLTIERAMRSTVATVMDIHQKMGISNSAAFYENMVQEKIASFKKKQSAE